MKSKDMRPRSPSAATLSHHLRRHALWIALTMAIGLPAAQAQQVHPDGGTHTGVLNAANGVPVVNIAAPNGAGVSHNTYQQFDVGSNGLILNNSSAISTTQLAGYITGNPNLGAGQSASLILNEVTSTLPSQLNGVMEVAGNKAQVVVANPNGISCEGCGFINASRGVLTTGTPVFASDGSLSALRVTGGTITIGGMGMDGTTADRVDLLARAVAINAGVWAKQLNIVTGPNQIDYATLDAQSIAGTGSKPVFALDVAALGGMYANAIRLVGTEAGLGVNNQGQIAAQNGDLSLTSAGQVVLGGKTTATGNLVLDTTQALTNQGTLAAGGAVSIASGNLANSGTLYGNGALTLSANGTVSNSGQIEAQSGALDVKAQGAITGASGSSVYAGGPINLSGASFGNAGALESAQGVVLQVTGDASNSGSLAADAGNVNLTAATIENTGRLAVGGNAALNAATSLTSSGTLVANGAVTLAAPDLTTAGTVQGGSALSLSGATLTNSGKLDALAGAWTATLSGAFANQGGGAVYGSQNVAVNAASLTNAGGIEAQQGDAITLTGAFIISGTLQSDQADVALTAASLANGGTLSAQRNLQLQVSGAAQNSGVLVSGQVFNLTSSAFDNQASGQIQSGSDLAVVAATQSNEGAIDAKGNAILTGTTLSNASGAQWLAAGTLTLDQTGAVSNAGVLQAGGGLTMTQAASLANGGTLQTLAGNLTLAVGTLSSSGTLGAGGNATLSANTSLASTGTLLAGGALTLTAPSLTTAGAVQAGSALSLSGTTLTNSGKLDALDGAWTATLSGAFANQNGGAIYGNQNVTVNAASLTNAGGVEAQQGDAITLTGAFANSGTLQSDQADVALTAASLANSGTLSAQRDLQLQTSGAAQNSGVLVGGQAFNLTSSAFDNQASGQIQSGTDLAVAAAAQSNEGAIDAKGNATLTGTTLSNASGAQWLAAGTLTLNQIGGVSNAGVLQAGSGLELEHATALANSGTLQTLGGNLTLAAGTLASSGTLGAGGNATLGASQSLSSTGKLVAGGVVTLTATSLITAGIVQAGGALSLSGTTLTNSGKLDALDGAWTATLGGAFANQNGGAIYGSQNVAVNAASLINAGGIEAQQGEAITLTGAFTNSGTLQSDQADVALTAASLANGGTLSAQRNLQLQVSGAAQNSGVLVSGQAFNLSSATFDNQAQGQIQSGTDGVFASATLDNEGAIDTKGNATLTGTTLSNASGAQWLTAGTFTLDQTGDVTNAGVLQAGSGLTMTQAASLTNSGTLQTLGGNLTLAVGTLASSGTLGAGGNATLGANQSLSSTGKLLAGGVVTLTAPSLTTAGTVQAGSALSLSGATLTNSGKLYALAGAWTATLGGAFANQDGGAVYGSQNVAVNAASLTNAGGIEAQQGDAITLTGAFTNSGTLQSDQADVALTAASLANGGTLSAQRNLQLQVSGAAQNSGVLVSGQAFNLTSSAFDNQASGQIQSGSDLTVAAAAQSNEGAIDAKGNAVLSGTTLTNASGAQWIAAGTLTLDQTGAVSNAGVLQAGGGLTMAQAASLANGGTLQTLGGNLTLATGTLDSTGTLGAGGSATLGAGQSLSSTGKLVAGGAVTLAAPSLTTAGIVQAGGALSLSGTTLTNSGKLYALAGAWTATLGGAFANQAGGAVYGSQNVTVNAASLTNAGGVEAQQGDAITLTGAFANSGTLQSDQADLVVDASALTNSGTLSAQRDLQLQTSGTAQNSGVLVSGQAFNLASSAFDNQASGQIQSGADASFAATTLSNEGGIGIKGNLTLAGTSLSNASGAQWLAAGTLTLDQTGDVTNAGVLQAGGNLDLEHAPSLTNSGTLLTTAGNLTLLTGTLASTGTLGAQGAAVLGANQSLSSTGTLSAGGALSLSSAQLTTAGTVETGGALTLDGGTLSNAGKLYALGGAWTATLSGAFTNQGKGDVYSSQGLTLDAASLNSAGGIEARQAADITVGGAFANSGALQSDQAGIAVSAASLTNTGTLSADQVLQWQVAQAAQNSGVLVSGQAMNLSSASFDNQAGGQMQSGTDLALSAATVGNEGTVNAKGNAVLGGTALSNAGQLLAAGTLTVGETGAVSNAGVLQAGSNLTLTQAASFANAAGATLYAGQDLNLGLTQALTNAGMLYAARTGTLSVGSADNTGTLRSGGNLALTSTGDLVSSGAIQAQQGVTLRGGADVTNGGKLYAIDGGLTVQAAGAFSSAATGDIYSGQAIGYQVGSFANAGTLEATQGVAITAQGQADNSGTLQADDGNVTITAGGLANQGTLSANGNQQLVVSGTLSNAGKVVANGTLALAGADVGNSGQMQSAGNTTLQAAAIDNSGRLQSGGALTISHNTSLTNEAGGLLLAAGDIGADTASLLSNAGTIQSGGNLSIEGTGALDTLAGGTLYGAALTTLQLGGGFTSAGTVYGGQGLQLTAVNVDNAGVLRSDAALSVTTQGDASNGGTAYAVGNAGWSVGGALTDTGVLASAANTTLSVGSLAGNGTLAAGLQGDGKLGTSGALDVTAAGSLAAQGRVLAAGNLVFSGQSINLSGSQTRAGGDLTLSATQGDVTNTGGDLAANGTVSITTPGSLVNGGTTAAQGGKISGSTLSVAAAALDNGYGTLTQTGTGNLTLSFAGAFDNAGGTLAQAGKGTLTLTAGGDVTNTGGRIAGNGALNLQSGGTFANAGGTLSVAGDATVRAVTIDDSQGTWIADGISATATQAFTNTGGTLQSAGALTLDAGSLDNTGGFLKVTGAQALGLDVGNALTNGSGGFIGGNGDVTLQAGSLTNAGQVYAGQTLGATVQGALDNTGGALQAMGSLSATSGGALGNRSGQIEAGAGDGNATLSLTAASLDNTAGRIADSGQGAATVNGGQSITNEGGTLGGQGAVALSAGSLDNSQGGHLVAGQDLDFTLGGMNNAGGTVYAAGNLTWNNANASLANSAGNLGAGGDLALTLQSLDDTGGAVDANGSVTLAAATLTDPGHLAAGQNLTLTTSGSYVNTTTSQLTANNNLTLNLGGSFSNAAGATLQAPGQLTIRASSIDNAAGATLNSNSTTLATGGALTNEGNIEGSAVTLDADALDNTATIMGGTIAATANTLTNGADLGTTTGNSAYQSALIAGSNSIALYVGGTLLNRDATIFTTGNLTIAADANGDASQAVTNLSGDIEADGNVILDAAQFTNQRRVFQTTTVDLTAAQQAQNTSPDVTLARYLSTDTNPDHQPPNVTAAQVIGSAEFAEAKAYCDGRMSDNARCDGYPNGVGAPVIFQSLSTDMVTSVTQLAAASAQSRLLASGNITLNGSVLNDKSTIAAGNNLLINGSTSTATVQNIAWAPTAQVAVTTLDQTDSQYLVHDPRRWVDGGYWTYGTTTSQAQISLAPGAVPSWVSYDAGAGLAASLTAGNTVSITAQTIDNTVVNAGGQPVQTAINLGANSGAQNVAGSAAGTVAQASGTGGGVAGVAVGNAPGQASSGSLSLAGAHGRDGTAAPGATTTQGVGLSGASAPGGTTAPGATTLQGVGLSGASAPGGTTAPGATTVQGVGLSGASAPGGASSPTAASTPTVATATSSTPQPGTVTATTATGTAPASASTPAASHAAAAAPGNTASVAAPQVVSTLVGPQATVTLPQSGLYTVTTSPTAHYLIETNPQFTQYTQFISSDYLLQQLGYNPEATEERLGDGFYEEQQVLDQITDLTGRRFLGNDTDALAQYRQLMGNAVGVAKQFDLSVGVALTPAQMASLTQDIVWLVNVTVDGHQVLEPVVYLSASDAKHLAASGATIAGTNVILDASGNLTNNGTIAASNDAQITANNLLNSGTISAGNDLSINAAQDILNGGTISAGGNVSLVAGNDVLSGVSVAQGLGAVSLAGLGSPVGSVALTNLSMPGSISAGGNLSISAGRDLTLDTAPVAAGANLSLAAGRDLTATATAITAGGDAQLLAGRDLSLLATASTNRLGEAHNSTETTLHTVSTLTAGGTLSLLAGGDLLSQGTQLTGSTLHLAAAHDLTLAAVTDSTTRLTQGLQGHTVVTTGQTDQTVRGSTLTGLQGITVAAGHDLTAVAGTLTSANGNVALAAGNDLTLNAAQQNDSSFIDTSASHHGFLSSSKTTTQATTGDSYAIGTTVSGNDVTLAAGHDLTTQAAQLEANGALSLSAVHDVALGAGEQTHTSTYSEEHTSSSVFNTSATRFGSLDPESYSRGSQSSTAQTWSIGSTLSGDTVSVAAGHDLSGTAVQIAGTHDVTLAAGNNLTLTAGQDTYSQSDSTKVSRTGLMNGGGFSALIGNRTTQDADTVNDVSYTGSLVGSTNGAVTLTAGNDVHITGSDVLSQTATTIVGKNVTIDAALGSEDVTQTHKQSSAGISVGLSGGVAAVAQSVYGAAQGASQSSDSRLKALYAMQAAQDLFSPGAGHAMGLSNGETGYQALTNAPGALARSGSAQQASQNTGISLHVGIGGGSSTNTAKTHDDVAYGSQISSQGNVTIAATNGDLNVVGSQVNGNDVALSASHDLNLLSQAEQHTDSNTSHNASGEVGLSIGQTTGIYLSAAAGEALAHGNGTTHEDTVVNAANTLTLVSGNDATIRGAQATGSSVLANIGGNLDVASEQDTNDYASHSIQAGITLVYGWSNGGVGVSGNLSASKANSSYASVTQMSGIGAGHGGFDIDVHGNTDLTGAVIASTANPADNLLTTGSLTYSNIENVAKSSAESVSVGGGYGTGSLSGMTSLTGGIGVPQNSDQHSTTQAGIAQGTIVVGNDANPNLSGLDRNPSLGNANGLIDSFNPQKVSENQQVGLLAGQVGMTAAGDLASAMMANDAKNSDLAGAKSWSAGGSNEVLLHAVVGGAAAALGGGNALQGALGAGAGEYATGLMDTQLAKNGLNPNASPEAKAILDATSVLVGAVAGGGSGVSTALSGQLYNQQLHPQVLAELLSDVPAFAKEYGLSESDASNRLLLEAMRLQDNGTNLGISTDEIGGSKGLSDDAQARAFLAANDNFTVNGQAVDIFQPAAPDDTAVNAYALYNYLYQNPTASQAFYGAQEYEQAQRGLTTNDSQQNQLLAQWANQDVIGNYLPADQAKQVDEQVSQTEKDFLMFEGKLVFYGGTAGIGAEFSALSGVLSGGVTGYQSGGWKGAAMGAVVGGTVGRIAPGITNQLLPYADNSGVGVMLGRTAIFSGVNGFGSGVSTALTNIWAGKSPSDDVLPSFAIGAFAPIGSGESFLWGTGGDLVYGEKVANGFSWVTGGMATGATGLDPNAEHGFSSGSSTEQPTLSSSPNYGDGPAGSQTTLLNLGQSSCAGSTPNKSNQSGVTSPGCKP